MVRDIITAVDIGTSSIQTVVAERKRGEEGLQILGVGIAPAQGMRRGAIIDLEDAATAIRKSVEEARRNAGVSLRNLSVGIGGAHISVSSSRGVVAVSRADGEISNEDIRRAISAAETFIPKNPNKEVLHIMPRDFKVDHESGIKDPVGMHGVRLEVDTLIVECSAPFLRNLFKSIEMAGYRVQEYIFGPYAAAHAVLSKRQKELGVMLIDIGGATASFMVFEEGMPVHAGVLPIGGAHITNDIAIGFRTHVDVAEQMKLVYGSCLPGEISKRDTVRVAELIAADGVKDFSSDAGSAIYSRRELAEMIEARLTDIFELIRRELKKINRAELLPAGVVLVGGSAKLPGIAELARQELRLPVERGIPQEFLSSFDEETIPLFTTVLGILRWSHLQRGQDNSFGIGARFSRLQKHPWVKWLKSFLP